MIIWFPGQTGLLRNYLLYCIYEEKYLKLHVIPGNVNKNTFQ